MVEHAIVRAAKDSFFKAGPAMMEVEDCSGTG